MRVTIHEYRIREYHCLLIAHILYVSIVHCHGLAVFVVVYVLFVFVCSVMSEVIHTSPTIGSNVEEVRSPGWV